MHAFLANKHCFEKVSYLANNIAIRSSGGFSTRWVKRVHGGILQRDDGDTVRANLESSCRIRHDCWLTMRETARPFTRLGTLG